MFFPNIFVVNFIYRLCSQRGCQCQLFYYPFSKRLKFYFMEDLFLDNKFIASHKLWGLKSSNEIWILIEISMNKFLINSPIFWAHINKIYLLLFKAINSLSDEHFPHFPHSFTDEEIFIEFFMQIFTGCSVKWTFGRLIQSFCD